MTRLPNLPAPSRLTLVDESMRLCHVSHDADFDRVPWVRPYALA